MLACPSCGEPNPERARFCLNCGAAMTDAGLAERAQETRRTVTVIFADVAGSTNIGERLDPEALREVMQRYFDAMRVAIERHEGTVEKFIGDAVMAVFGIPQLHEDDALRAVRAAFDMQAALATLNRDIHERWGVELAIRTGINTGEVVAGDAASGQALATGDVVNTAARLEQNAGAGEILIGGETYRLVRHAVNAEAAPPLELKGKAEPFTAWRLTAVDPTMGAQARHMDSPMVGRDRQLHVLLDVAERAREDNAPQLVTILGLAGVGKSRLVHEFLGRIRDEATVVRGRCLSYGDAITYWPLAEALRGVAGIEADDPPDTGVARLETLLGGALQADVIARRVASAIGLVADDSGAGGQETFWAIRRLFETMARHRPLVAVFDDVQWATPTFLDLLEHIADWSRDAPILIVAIARPELLEVRPTWGGGKVNATTLMLEPLDEAAVGEILDNLVGRVPLPADLARKVEAAADGNPFFVEELLSMLVDDGILERDGDAYRVTRTPSEIAIPPTIELLLAARLDHLPQDERATLGRASVVGKRFGASEVAQLSPEIERESSLTRLMGLVRKELVRLDEQSDAEPDALDEEMRFRFRHQLVRDAAYEALPKHERARLHEVFADWMESALANRLEELHEVVGYHLEQACLYLESVGGASERSIRLARRAVAHLAAGAHRAQAIGDNRAMRRLLDRAIALLPPNDPQRLRLLPRLAEALADLGQLDDAQAAVDEVLRANEADPAARAEALELVELQFERGRAASEVAPMVEEALGIRRELGDGNGIARALRARAGLEWFTGSLDQSLRTLEEALPLAKASGDVVLEADIRLKMLPSHGLSRNAGPRDGRLVQELVEFARSHGNVLMEMVGMRGLAFFTAQHGDREAAIGILDQAARKGLDLGLTLPLGMAGDRGAIEEWYGNTELALADYQETARHLRELGERGYLSSMAASTARLQLDLEHIEEAREALRIAEEVAAADDVGAQVEILADRARIRAREGDIAGAEELSRRAVDMADGTDYINLFVVARLALADVLRLAGRRDEAMRYIDEAAAAEERRESVAYPATIRRIPQSW